MKIQGVLSVEGVRLHVDVEAADDEQDLYVTNVHPNCLVVPKERWRIEFLGLPPAALLELKRRQIFTLGQLVDESWNLGVDGFSTELATCITEALGEFRKIALVFERQASYRPLQALPITESEQAGTDIAVSQADAQRTDIAELGLPRAQERVLRKTRNVQTYGDLVALGRNRLLMTSQITSKTVQRIEETLRGVGLNMLD